MAMITIGDQEFEAGCWYSAGSGSPVVRKLLEVSQGIAEAGQVVVGPRTSEADAVG